MMRRAIAGLIVLLLASANVAAAERKALQTGWQTIALGSASLQYRFAAYANHRLGGSLDNVKQAIVIQHGLNRDGAAYYEAAARLMAELQVDPRQTLLLAPQFFATVDTGESPLTGMPVWSAEGWVGGEMAVTPAAAVSALQVYDDLIAWLTDRKRFPALQRIVLAGHSAGGQLVQRYAVLNDAGDTLRRAGTSLKYVIANPSSYLYFSDERPQGDRFVPYDAAVCPGFNDFKYGFAKPVPYAANRDPLASFERYAARDVTYLLGGRDTNPNHRVLDKTCPAQAQGAHRLERGLAYLRYERQLAGERTKLNRRAYEVTGVGHNQRRMLGSTCAARAIFDSGSAPANGAPCTEIAQR